MHEFEAVKRSTTIKEMTFSNRLFGKSKERI